MARIIKNGPGKFELMEALFSEQGHGPDVTFEIEVPEAGSEEAQTVLCGHKTMDLHEGHGAPAGVALKVTIFVDSVGKNRNREHPSVWDFTGHTICDGYNKRCYPVKGVYSTKNRKGAIMYADE